MDQPRRAEPGRRFAAAQDPADAVGALEQLFFNRPVPGWARYRTPVDGLWMCGSATHPGGGIMGAPGRIAALEYLKHKRKGRRAA